MVDSAPKSETVRTAAMCLACLVPTVTGLAIVLMHRATIAANPIPEYLYGTYGSFDRFVITVVVPVVACAGGPLLGVAVGRWLRFPGAALLSVLVVLIWSNIAAYVPGNSSRFGHVDGSSLFARVLHMATPYTAFATGDGDGEHATRVMTSYTGSPGWYAVWTLALCGLAVCAALWRGAAGEVRRLVGRAFVVLVVIALVSLVLAVVNGNQRLYTTTRSGTSPVTAALALRWLADRGAAAPASCDRRRGSRCSPARERRPCCSSAQSWRTAPASHRSPPCWGWPPAVEPRPTSWTRSRPSCSTPHRRHWRTGCGGAWCCWRCRRRWPLTGLLLLDRLDPSTHWLRLVPFAAGCLAIGVVLAAALRRGGNRAPGDLAGVVAVAVVVLLVATDPLKAWVSVAPLGDTGHVGRTVAALVRGRAGLRRSHGPVLPGPGGARRRLLPGASDSRWPPSRCRR